MFKILAEEYVNVFTALNLFNYITFRTGAAILTSLFFSLFFGKFIIKSLSNIQPLGQPIRDDGPKEHIITKAGTPTMVGERGPELFVPNTGGVVKNNADTKQMVGSGGGVSITQNLNFAVGVTNTVRAEVMNMLPAIQQSTVNAVAEAKQRGGKFSKAFGS